MIDRFRALQSNPVSSGYAAALVDACKSSGALEQVHADMETLDAYVRRWLDASPAKARAALEASLATADAGAGGSKAGALVAAARADTTKVRAKLREAILAAFEGETGW